MTNFADRARPPRLTGRLLFAAEAGRDLRTTGAIAPSGSKLAHALIEPVRRSVRPTLSILEVGSGTGALTRALATCMGPTDTLTCVEKNPRLVEYLRRQVDTDTSLRVLGDRITVREADVVEGVMSEKYHAIVVGLPFANFTASETRAICHALDDALVPGGTLTYFSYLGASIVDNFTGDRHSRRRRHSAQALAEFRTGFRQSRRTVWANVPPAHAWTLTRPAEAHLPNGRASRPPAS
ncbi:methyltransferase domain-containing protein [Prescottella soli]|uniref:Protein-L-isoaspartate O-methyltransferase n=1 Tax=Prescottella soli TaxID=1543852 RepID=A0ABW9FRR2_9NOCA